MAKTPFAMVWRIKSKRIRRNRFFQGYSKAENWRIWAEERFWVTGRRWYVQHWLSFEAPEKNHVTRSHFVLLLYKSLF